MSPLDPIVSLCVAVAEAPGSYAFLLGSGVSSDAGVPTGGEVYWQSVGELYRVENSTETTPQQDELAAWLADNDRAGLGYSEILELVAPDPATRRDYLAKHFEGVTPGPTHEHLALLAERGLIRVFITTNFDRLLEHALGARGIEPVIVTCAADLAIAPAREHSTVYILKPHGDYLQETIRNTPSELATLETEIERELQEIADRYGIVVLGYSGSDEGVATALRGRRSRYGLYWTARGGLSDGAQAIVEATGGRVITRDGASDFLADLEQRIAVLEAHPSGITPAVVHDEVLALVRVGDRVGLGELLRRERTNYASALDEELRARHPDRPDAAGAIECQQTLLPAIERRAASLLPLARYEADVFRHEVESLARPIEQQTLRQGFYAWIEIPGWCAWWVSMTVGAALVSERHWGPAADLLRVTVTHDGYVRPLLDGRVPSGEIAQLIMEDRGHPNYFSPSWELLKDTLPKLDWLKERYPDLFSGDGEPLGSLARFDFLLTLARGLEGAESFAHWTMAPEPAGDFARALYLDERLRRRVTEALGVSLEELDGKTAEELYPTQGYGQFPRFGALHVLKTGSSV